MSILKIQTKDRNNSMQLFGPQDDNSLGAD